MANYLPFNSIDHDRVYKAEDWAWYFSTFIGNGIFPKPTNGLMVVANGAMDVVVKAGYGFVNGYAFRNQDDYVITINIADGSLGRIDRVVLRWDLTNRQMVLDVLQGTPSADPQPVALTRTADTYELALADISVTRGLTTISQANITDRRSDTDLCGIVEGTVSQIDWDTLTAQLDAFMTDYTQAIQDDYDDYVAQIEGFESDFESDANTWMSDQQSDFTTWVETIQDILDETTAGHLQLEIETLQSQVGIPDEYDVSVVYQPGDFCIYNNLLQKCIKTTLAGGFDQGYWRATSVLAEIALSVEEAKEKMQGEMARGYLTIDSGLSVSESGDRLILNESSDLLAVRQTIKFNYA